MMIDLLVTSDIEQFNPDNNVVECSVLIKNMLELEGDSSYYCATQHWQFFYMLPVLPLPYISISIDSLEATSPSQRSALRSVLRIVAVDNKTMCDVTVSR
jgi:hypothetical protein